jgi:phage/plasmid primase-like uncharacterized protein/phage/plasmid-associated DNA primase
MRRFDREGALNGWYRGTTVPAGGKILYIAHFGDWRTGESYTWQSEKPSSPEENAAMEAAIAEAKAREEEGRAARHEEVAQLAQFVWDGSIDRGTTPYLDKKKIDSLFGCRIDSNSLDTLLVPLRDADGKLWGLQRILPSGQKIIAIRIKNPHGEWEIHSGTRKKGSFHTIGEIFPESEILIAEGFATGASLAMAVNLSQPVVVAVDKGNLGPVCAALREKYPRARLTICADDDQWTKRNGASWNPGREAALACSKLYGTSVRVPRFASLEGRPTDFNDLHVREGIETLREQLKESPGKVAEFSIAALPARTNAKGKEIGPPTQKQVADRLLELVGEDLLQDSGDLFRYTGTHWEMLSDAEIRRLKRLTLHLGGDEMTFAQLEASFKMFLLALPTAVEPMRGARMPHANFENGTLWLLRERAGAHYTWKMEFRDHEKSDLLTHTLPFKYEPEGQTRNELFEQMLERVFGGDPDRAQKVAAIQEMYGACLVAIRPRLFILVGRQGSGKSSLLIPATRMVAPGMLCSVEPHEFQGFVLGEMAGKLVNCVTDLSTRFRMQDAIVKRIEDRVPIRMDRKFKEALNLPLPPVHIFGANELPPMEDGASGAHTRRWTVVTVQQYQAKEGEFVQDYGQLVYEHNPQGVVNFAIAGIRRLIAQNAHYTVPESGREDMREWQERHDPIALFLRAVEDGESGVQGNVPIGVGEGRQITRSALWDLFYNWHLKHHPDDKMPSSVVVYKALRQKGFGEKKIEGVRHFVGIGLGASGDRGGRGQVVAPQAGF